MVPKQEALIKDVDRRTDEYFEIIPYLKRLNTEVYEDIFDKDFEYYDEDFPNGYMDFSMENHKGFFVEHIFNESVMREKLKDTESRLYKNSMLLQEFNYEFGNRTKRLLIYENQIPVVDKVGNENLLMIENLIRKMIEDSKPTQSETHIQVAMNLQSVILQTLLDTAPPRYKLL